MDNPCSKEQKLCSRCSSFCSLPYTPPHSLHHNHLLLSLFLFLPARTSLQGVPRPFRSDPGLHPDEQLYPDATFAGLRCHPPTPETSYLAHQKDSVARSRAKPSSCSYPIQRATFLYKGGGGGNFPPQTLVFSSCGGYCYWHVVIIDLYLNLVPHCGTVPTHMAFLVKIRRH